MQIWISPEGDRRNPAFARLRKGGIFLRLPGVGLGLILGAVGFFAIFGFVAYLTSFFGVDTSGLPSILSSSVASKSSELDTRLAEVKKYEDALKARTSALRSVLEETKLFAPETKGARDANRVAPKGGEKRLGVGGGAEFKSPMFSNRRTSFSEAARARLRDGAGSKSAKLLRDVDVAIDLLHWLPIGAPVNADTSSGFGYRRSPFEDRIDFHSGLDFSAELGTPVLAVADGIVIESGKKGAYGRAVMIDHGDGIETLYGHLSAVDVQEGQHVHRGTQLGKVGSTGNSTGPHLHYEIRVNGVPRNPKAFVRLASSIRDTF